MTMRELQDQGYMTPNEYAEKKFVVPATVRLWIQKDKVDYVKVGGRYYVRDKGAKMNKGDLARAQDIIADGTFQYRGDSILIIDIIDAIKNGYRLVDMRKFEKEMDRLKKFMADWKANSTPQDVEQLIDLIEKIVRKCE